MTTETSAPAGHLARSHEPGRLAGCIVGLVSAAAALGAAQLVAGLVSGASSPMIAVGGAAIDATPAWLKDAAIRTFGSNDKEALLVGIGVVTAIAAAAIGMRSVRHPRAGVIGILVFGAIGVVASISRPANGLADAIPSIAGTAVGLFAYRRLRAAAGMSDIEVGRTDPAPAPASPPVYDRRRLLRTGVVTAGLAAVSGVIGQYLVRRADASESRAAVRIPHRPTPRHLRRPAPTCISPA